MIFLFLEKEREKKEKGRKERLHLALRHYPPSSGKKKRKERGD